jgi:hypothetical protein
MFETVEWNTISLGSNWAGRLDDRWEGDTRIYDQNIEPEVFPQDTPEDLSDAIEDQDDCGNFIVLSVLYLEGTEASD